MCQFLLFIWLFLRSFCSSCGSVCSSRDISALHVTVSVFYVVVSVRHVSASNFKNDNMIICYYMQCKLFQIRNI